MEKEWRLHAKQQPKQQAKLTTGTRPLPESGAPALVPIDAPFTASLRPTAAVPESTPPRPDSDVEEAATGTWASPLDNWDEPTVAYPPVRET